MKRPFQTALTSHRRDDSPSITIDVPIKNQLDADFCDVIRRECASLDGGWAMHIANSNTGRLIPEKSGLYLFVYRCAFELPMDDDGPKRRPVQPAHVLYVGQAGGKTEGTIRARYEGEYAKYVDGDPEELWVKPLNKLNRKQLLSRFLTLDPLEFWYCTTTDKRMINKLERDLIHIFNPPLNTQLKPDLLYGGQSNAFVEP